VDANPREARALADNLVRAGRRLMTSPLPEESTRGLHAMVIGLKMIREVARVTADVPLTRDASTAVDYGMRLADRDWRELRRQYWFSWASTGDLSDTTRVRQLLLDNRFHPFERWGAARSLVTSYCMSAREILFGINPARLEYLAFAAGRSNAATREWIRWQSERLERLMTDPEAQLQIEVRRDSEAERTATDALLWLGLRDLHGRMKLCESLGF
jgi:hypothetical protein